MNLQTGDILVWRSTNGYDKLGAMTINLENLHLGLVFKGKEFEKLSRCGASPSHTYVTFLVDSIFPIEEIIGHIWHRPNGAYLYHLKRISGRDISSKEAFKVWTDYIAMQRHHTLSNVYIAIAAYFRWGGIAPKAGHNNKRWNLCSMLIGYILKQLGIVHPDAEENNLLPMDFYNLRFYQTEQYVSICIFDKQTYTKEWFFSSLLISLGQLQIEPLYNSTVDKLLANYDYPRDPSISGKT